MEKRTFIISLSGVERKDLEAVVRRRSAPQREVQRAQIILLAAEGLTNTEIGKRVRLSRQIVAMWRGRFFANRLAGLKDKPRRGRSRTYTEEDRLRVIKTVCNEKPEGETHWSIRTLAAKTGVGRETVHRVLQAEKLKPHLTRSWVLSNDPEFEAKALDIVGLYLNPPENTLVLSVDEKTSIQALDRTQPLMPLRPGQPERRSFDYKRNGTTSLYAALAVHLGEVTANCTRRHTHQEFLDFLKQLVKTYPQPELHLIVDNLSAHKHKNVRTWLEKHPRVKLHFTPTHASWLNQVEIWFGILSRKVIRRGVFHSVKDLIQAIMAFIKKYNQEGKPFRWTYTGLLRSNTNSVTIH